MQRFLTRHDVNVVGVLHGFDRVLFRGTLRWISYLSGMEAWLASQGVLYKSFGKFAEALSRRVSGAKQGKNQPPIKNIASPGRLFQAGRGKGGTLEGGCLDPRAARRSEKVPVPAP